MDPTFTFPTVIEVSSMTLEEIWWNKHEGRSNNGSRYFNAFYNASVERSTVDLVESWLRLNPYYYRLVFYSRVKKEVSKDGTTLIKLAV